MATLRKVDLQKNGANRKLILGLVVITGVTSLGLWIWGRVTNGEGWGSAVESVILVPTLMPTTKPVDLDRLAREKLVEKMKKEVEGLKGGYGVYVYRLEEGIGYGFGEDIDMPGASILKVPVLVLVQKMIDEGKLGLEDKLVLTEADRRAGSGPLQFKPAGTAVTLGQVLTYLTKNSDNTAWVMLNRKLGMAAVELTISDLGMTHTNYREITTTARDVAVMWKKIYKGDDWEKLKEYLVDSIYEDRLPAGVPEGVRVVHKVGTDADVWADAGIIIPQIPNPPFDRLRASKSQDTNNNQNSNSKAFILVILNKGVDREEAKKVVPELTGMIWEYETNRVK